MLVYVLACALMLVVAGPFAAEVVGIAWGIAVASHGFFAVLAPRLRSRWIAEAVDQYTPRLAGSTDAVEQRRSRSLEELAAAIAHEIRNPITAAKSLVQQLAEDPNGPDAEEQATVAVEELDRVERSIAHLLRFAREEPFEPVDLDPARVVESAVQLMRDRAEKEHVSLVTELDPIPTIRADGEQIRAVLANLIGNALDAHAEHRTEGATVTVTAGRNLADTEVWIRVKDNGPGIPREAREKIFRPFYTSKKRGTGLGLALARKILDRHGGTIDVTSEPG